MTPASTTGGPAASPLIVLVCGSRDFPDPFRVALAIDERMASLPAGSTVIHGAARGADAIAAEAAKRHGHTVRPFPVNDQDQAQARHIRRPKFAPIARNLRMLNEKPDLVIAFYNGESNGTNHVITEARKRDIPVDVVWCGPVPA